MWIKGMTIIGAGLAIDFLQAVFAWVFLSLGAGFAAATPVVGSITGATVACVVGGTAAGIATVATVGGAAPTLAAAAAACAALGVGGAAAGGAAGAVIGAAGIPLGIGLGFMSSICISLTMGAGFIVLLLTFRMYYPAYIWSVFIGEAIPGLDIIPGWTLLAIRCIMKKNAEQGGGAGIAPFVSRVASAALSPASAAGALGSMARGFSNIKAETGTMARSSPLINRVYESKPVQQIARQRQQLAADVRRSTNADITPPQASSSGRQPYAKTA